MFLALVVTSLNGLVPQKNKFVYIIPTYHKLVNGLVPQNMCTLFPTYPKNGMLIVVVKIENTHVNLIPNNFWRLMKLVGLKPNLDPPGAMIVGVVCERCRENVVKVFPRGAIRTVHNLLFNPIVSKSHSFVKWPTVVFQKILVGKVRKNTEVSKMKEEHRRS